MRSKFNTYLLVQRIQRVYCLLNLPTLYQLPYLDSVLNQTLVQFSCLHLNQNLTFYARLFFKFECGLFVPLHYQEVHDGLVDLFF